MVGYNNSSIPAYNIIKKTDEHISRSDEEVDPKLHHCCVEIFGNWDGQGDQVACHQSGSHDDS